MKQIAENLKTHLIAQELEASPQLWGENTIRTGYEGSPHAGCQDIWLRFRSLDELGHRTPESFCNDPYTPVWLPAIEKMPHTRKIIERVFEMVGGEELGACLLAKIPPGGCVKPHRDLNWNARYFPNKYLVCVKATPKQVFVYRGEEFVHQTGDLVLFDNTQEHAVYNNDQTEDRISLIISVRHRLHNQDAA